MIRQFMKVSEIAKETGFSDAYIRKAVNEMRGCPRYVPSDFFGASSAQAVRLVAVQDYLSHRDAILAGIQIPELDREAREQELGIGPFAVHQMVDITDADLERLVAKIVRTIGRGIAGAAIS